VCVLDSCCIVLSAVCAVWFDVICLLLLVVGAPVANVSVFGS